MQTNRMRLQCPIAVLAMGIWLMTSGCATPPVIKTASKTQCELIGELDQSVQALENGLVQFHEDNQEQIRQVGRVLIAQQAINVIMEPPNNGIPTTNGATTVDALLETSNTRIRPFVDYAFSDAELQDEIAQVTGEMNAATNAIARALLHTKLESLTLKQAQLSNKPPAVAQLEGVLEGEIAKQEQTEQEVKQILDVVRAQAGLMKVMATTVDSWLALDVTVTQAQADNLETAVVNAQKALGGGK